MACNSINSTIEIFTVALLAILVVSVLLKKKKNKWEWLLFSVLVLHMINTLGDLAAWRFTGRPDAFSYFMTTAGNFTTYLFGAITYFMLLLLIYLEIVGKDKPKGMTKFLMILICIVSIFNISLLFYNYQSGILFTIDQNNIFTWGKLSSLPDNLILLQLVLLLPAVLCQRQYSIKKSLFLFSLYASGPLLATLLENWYTTLMLLYPTVAVSLLLLYINLQHMQENLLIQKELELSDSRVKLLLGQIQPHFIFNSLLAIQELCADEPVKAESAIKDFSKYLRGNLDAMSCNHLIPFEKELDHIRHYLALEMMDPATNLQVVYHLDTTDFMVPPLSVQPIVENAVRHGIGTCSEKNTVTISTHKDLTHYIITVQDDGIGFNSATEQQQLRHGVGIDNVKTRLSAQCGGSLNIESSANGTLVTIMIPEGDY